MVMPDTPLMWTLLGVLAALLCGTAVRIVALRSAAAELRRSRLSSLKTWWILAFLLSVSIVSGRIGVLVLLTTAAAVGLDEYIRLVGWGQVGQPTGRLALAFVPTYFLLSAAGSNDLLREVTPIVFVIALGGVRAIQGLTQNYIRATSAMICGLLLFVYCLSHAAMLFDVAPEAAPRVGQSGWFLFLILLTETNDISQAIIGRRFGRTKITPRVSPNKSLEGLLGGIATTTVLAMVAAPWLTTITTRRTSVAGLALSATAGVLISVFGFLGDINMSGIKRDVGVKDGSNLLPGQGGMIDRVDSLTFTAPVFYWFVRMVT